jgi:Domain of unknown function (DUF6894)
MGKYYFDLRLEDDWYIDDIGAEQGDLLAAHRYAVLLASRLVSFFELQGRHSPSTQRWRIEIRDQACRVVLSLILSCNSAVSAWEAGVPVVQFGSAERVEYVRAAFS